MNRCDTLPQSVVAKIAGALLALIVLFGGTQSAYSQACSYGWGQMYVTSPSAGQQYTRNTTMTIRWYSNYTQIGNYNGTYTIDYSSNGGATWNNITSGVNGYATSYNWTIPLSVIAGTNFVVRVWEQPGPSWSCGFSYPGSSGVFTILKGCFAPVITQQPTSRTVCVNTPTTFTVASDLESGTYEWRRNGVTVATTTTNSYTIPSVRLSDAGLYDVVLREACNPSTAFTTSASAQLTVIEPPVVTVQMPATRSICENANDTLRVRATGAGRTFQWLKDGVAISGARDSNYVINNATATTAGVYTCVVSGTCLPSATSNPCTLSVVAKPRTTAEPTNLDLCVGGSGSLSMTATGSNLVYQWFKDGVRIPNATNPTLAFTNYDYTADGQYYCVATSNVPNPNNCVVAVQSRVVRVSGYRAPTVTTPPQSVDACLGSAVSLVAEFQGTGLSYEWFKNGVRIPNAASNSLTLTGITAADAADYTCKATGTCGLSVTSAAGKVTVISKPKLTEQPSSQTVLVGDSIVLSVNATDWRSIQWTKNSQPIQGATDARYVIRNANKSDAGFYNAIVRNTCGGVTTANAKISVLDPAVPEAAIQLTTNAVDFGEIPVGYDKSQQLDAFIKNVGTAPLTITGLAANPSDFSIVNGPALPLSLDPNATQSITVKASPVAKGTVNGTLIVSSNDKDDPTLVVSLAATYVLRYDHNTSVDFGTVMTDASKQECITLTNTSTRDITIEQATVTGANSGAYTVETTLPLAIAAGQTGEICVKFAPGTAGDKPATLQFRSSTGGNSSMNLSGKGEVPGGVVDAAVLGISAWPNPMTDAVEIRFPEATSELSITVMNASGRTVATFTHEPVPAGGSIRWNGRDISGAALASGSYTMIIRNGSTAVSLPISIVR